MYPVHSSVEHIGLASVNPTTLAAWYCEVLGAREVWNNGEERPAIFVSLPGGPILEIYPTDVIVSATCDNRTAGWRHLALRVPNLETAQAELTRRGVEWNQPIKPAGGGGRIIFFSDPEGNLLHLVERSGDSPFVSSEKVS